MTESVLIVGGAGSLGKEFVRLLHQDYQVTVVDSNEWAMAELRAEFPNVALIMDDFSSDHYLKAFNYAIVCAAYKHVDLCETNIKAAIENNLNKLIKFYGAYFDSRLWGVNHLLYISTDKAVEPISVYGATKMLAERLTWSLGGCVARCGNFLMSSGSVIPIWEKAIAEHKPIPITDEKMVRYVSEMSKAVPEIWERFKKGEKLIVPKTRKIRVLDLLAEVLKKHKYMNVEAYDPGVQLIGMRPGEKMTERLLWPHEEMNA